MTTTTTQSTVRMFVFTKDVPSGVTGVNNVAFAGWTFVELANKSAEAYRAAKQATEATAAALGFSTHAATVEIDCTSDETVQRSNAAAVRALLSDLMIDNITPANTGRGYTECGQSDIDAAVALV